MGNDVKSVRLTKAKIDALAAAKKPYIQSDSAILGLGVRVFPSGRKTWAYRYQIDGKRKLATLGDWPGMTVDAARDAASQARAKIRGGGSGPLADKEEARREQREAEAMLTVGGALDLYLADARRRVEDGDLALGSYRNYEGFARRTVRPVLGHLRVIDVRRRDMESIRETILKRRHTKRSRRTKGGKNDINRTVAFVRLLYTWLEDHEYPTPPRNPASRFQMYRETLRDRVLTDGETSALLGALDVMQDRTAATCIRFLLTVGWRASEALVLTWGMIDDEAGTATLPKSKTSKGKPDVRTIAGPALALLASLGRGIGARRVFAGLKYNTLLVRLKRASADAGIEPIVLHTLRHSCLTTLARAGATEAELRAVSGHSSPSTLARYVHVAAMRDNVERMQTLQSERLATLDRTQTVIEPMTSKPNDEAV